MRQLPNPDLLIRPAISREAVSTSVLEGTYAALSEVLDAQYTEHRRASAELHEVLNYIDAATHGLNADDDIPLLVKVALGHYQFETLHPFSDGNGRIGRLVITLQLIQAGALSHPILNLSPWLEPRRSEYVDHLRALSMSGDYNPWVAFFARAVEAQARAASATIKALLDVRELFLEHLRTAGAKGVVLELAGDLIGYPRISASRAAKVYGVSYPSANNAIARLVKLGILREVTGSTYGRIFACDRVYNIIAG